MSARPGTVASSNISVYHHSHLDVAAKPIPFAIDARHRKRSIETRERVAGKALTSQVGSRVARVDMKGRQKNGRIDGRQNNEHTGLGAKPLDSSAPAEASSPFRHSLAIYCVHTAPDPVLSFLSPKTCPYCHYLQEYSYNYKWPVPSLLQNLADNSVPCRAAWEPVT